MCEVSSVQYKASSIKQYLLFSVKCSVWSALGEVKEESVMWDVTSVQ